MKYILILTCVVLAACGQTTKFETKATNVADLVELGKEIQNAKEANITPYTFDTRRYPASNPFTATFQENGTNICQMEIVTNMVTQWLPIEREEGQRGARVKQIGILVTNQVLMVIAYDKTNEVILKVLGREEWPSQKRVVVVPNQQRK